MSDLQHHNEKATIDHGFEPPAGSRDDERFSGFASMNTDLTINDDGEDAEIDERFQ